MLVVETIDRIRREHFGHGRSIKQIAREIPPRLKLGRWKNPIDRKPTANSDGSAEPKTAASPPLCVRDLHHRPAVAKDAARLERDKE